jgi:4-oxalocrotonate tautomerase family enzyme
MWEGRPIEVKKEIIKAVTKDIAEILGIDQSLVTVIVMDVPKESWGVGGIPGDELK